MITAKRNKEGNIEISGTWYLFSHYKKNRMVFNADDCELDIPIEEYQPEWKPSEELLRELGFEYKGFTFDKERFWLFEKMSEHSICYDSKTNEFNLQEGNIFIHSDSELRMLVEILGREK